MKQNTEEVRYVYVRDYVDAKSGENRPLTIAYRFNDTDKVIEFNGAFCSPKDQFVKATGRLKATSRLLKGKKVPNGIVPYADVSEDGENPRYNLIAQKLHRLAVTNAS